jgi:hypothetical protein
VNRLVVSCCLGTICSTTGKQHQTAGRLRPCNDGKISLLLACVALPCYGAEAVVDNELITCSALFNPKKYVVILIPLYHFTLRLSTSLRMTAHILVSLELLLRDLSSLKSSRIIQSREHFPICTGSHIREEVHNNYMGRCFRPSAQVESMLHLTITPVQLSNETAMKIRITFSIHRAAMGFTEIVTAFSYR